MSSKNKKILYIASRVYVDNDPFLPIILTLAHQGADVKIVFQTLFSFEAVKISSSWWNWVTRFTRYRCLEYQSRYYVISKIVTYFRRTLFMLQLALSNDAIVLVPAKYATSRIFSMTRFMSNVWHYRGAGSFAKKERMTILNNLTSEQRVAVGKLPVSKKKNVTHVRKMVGLSREQLQYENEATWGKSLIIPYPHMQKWWEEFTRINPPKYSKREIDEATEIITIILLRKGNYYFAEGSDVDILLDEIITTVRKYYPETLIVLKPKFEWIPYWLDESGLKKRYRDKNIVLSYDSLIVLSEKTIFAISTCQSSAYYYMLSNGVPVIEYGRYSNMWKEIFPRVTTIEDYGGIFVQDIDSLDKCIGQITEHKINLDSFKEKIGYKDTELNINIFQEE